MSSTVRNGKIDLFRFLFSIMVVIFHFNKTLYDYRLFANGYIAVEFFFIVSGYLFARSLVRYPYQPKTVIRNSIGFMQRKFEAFFPYHLFFFIVCFTYTAASQRWGPEPLLSHFFLALPDLLLIQMGGISSLSLLRYEWYVSVMLMVMFLLTPLAIRYRKFFLRYFCPILFIGLTGYLFRQYHVLNVSREWTGLFYIGLLRAAAEIALGCIGYAVHEKGYLQKLPRPLLMIIEWGIYLLVLLYSCEYLPDWDDFTILFLLGIAVPLSFSEKTSLRFLNNRFIYFLGKLSFPIYLSQLFVLQIVRLYDFRSPIWHTVVFVLLTIIISLVCVLITDNMIRLIQRLRRPPDETPAPSDNTAQ